MTLVLWIMNVGSDWRKWIDGLDDEDVAFMGRFVLGSGSLKAVAATYGVSYPTVRIRLDRLIAKIEVLANQEITSEFERVARARHADGRIDLATLKELIAAYRKERETENESNGADR